MRADKNKKITIKRHIETQDEYGATIYTLTDVATLWASVEPLIGNEFFTAKEVKSEVTNKFRTYYLTGITTKDIIVYDNRTFDILSIINYKEQNRELLFMCKEVV